MPYSSPDDVPARVKAFWRNVGASEKDKRQWIHVFNSCMERFDDDSRCFRMANGVLSKKSRDEYIENSIQRLDTGMTKLDTQWGPVFQVPAILTREGVQNGFLKDAEELKATVWTANMIPVTDGHPKGQFDNFVSARSNIEFIRGFISDARFDESDKTVKGLVNIFDTPRNKFLVEDIQSERKIDGSVGFFTDEFQANGSFNGIEYEGVELNIIYDHYAVLPKGHGACSQKDGCGLGLNMQEEETNAGHGKEEMPAPGFSSVMECMQKHMWEARDAQSPEEMARHMQLAIECMHKKEEDIPPIDENKGNSISISLTEKKDLVLKELKEMGFEDTDIQEIDLDYDALYYMLGCNTCTGALPDIDYIVYNDIQYTFSPPWSQVNKTDLPSSAYMYIGDSEKKSTWKLPYKTNDGKIHCGAIRAIRQILAGAREDVNLPSEVRSNAKSLSDKHWAVCQKIKEKGDIIINEKYQYNDKTGDDWKVETITTQIRDNENLIQKVLNIKQYINTTINMPEDNKETPAPEPQKEDAMKILSDAVDSLKSERDALRVQVADLTKVVEESRKKETDSKNKEIRDLRNKVVNLNIAYKVWDVEHIMKMDEDGLKMAERLLTHFTSKKDFRGGQYSQHNVSLPSDFAPLTVGDLSRKQTKKGE